MFSLNFSRRDFLRSSIGLTGLTIPTFLQAKARSSIAGSGKAKSCIVIYCWGGIGHQETFDPKPDAPNKDARGEFGAIPTATDGIQFGELIPNLAKHSNKLAIVRSVHHNAGAHSGGIYYSLTGKAPTGGKAKDRTNWPSLTAMISRFQDQTKGAPPALRLPYNMYDNGGLMPGQFGGWLGSEYDPILIPTPAGKPFGGVSRTTGRELALKVSMKEDRIMNRLELLKKLEGDKNTQSEYQLLDQFRQTATNMLLDSSISDAYDLDKEDPRIRGMYGDHIGGQGLLLARRLIEAGVPVVQVCAGAGDLAGGAGDNWDTHRDHFPKMKKRLLPVFDQTVSALLTDLDMRGMLDETLVIMLTDFGRTPKVNGNGGRDHHPAVYSLFFAGGGIQGGQVYGASDNKADRPKENACTPGDIHATVYKAMGIDHRAELHDKFGRPFIICDGDPLPLF